MPKANSRAAPSLAAGSFAAMPARSGRPGWASNNHGASQNSPKPEARATRLLSQQRAAKKDKPEIPRAAQLAPQSPARHAPLKRAIALRACLIENQNTPRAADEATAQGAYLTENQNTPRAAEEAIAQRAYELYLAHGKAH